MAILSMQPVQPMERDQAWLDTIEVRFIDVASHRATVPAATKAMPEAGKPRPAMRRAVRPAATIPPVETVSPANNVSDSARAGVLQPEHDLPAGQSQATDYIPGGNGLRGQDFTSARQIRLPGAPTIKGAPRIRMVDPRTQGLAGVVRIIGSITGAVDKHCVDLDTWEGMSVEERIEHHVTEADMARARDEHGCSDPSLRSRTPPGYTNR
ncbi:hypothetical protein [Luteibacter sp.]|uniref:hypothetical protein n=1 Tax=Luteibacter sp. TaxID=1886636 RepID=UPI003F822745